MYNNMDPQSTDSVNLILGYNTIYKRQASQFFPYSLRSINILAKVDPSLRLVLVNLSSGYSQSHTGELTGSYLRERIDNKPIKQNDSL